MTTSRGSSGSGQHPAMRGAVVVTGGGKGIGATIARRFAEAGHPVLIFDRDEAAAASCADDIRSHGGVASTYVGSVTSEEDVAQAMRLAVERYAQLAVLVNNAGISCNRPTLELGLDEWRRTLDVNLTGVFLCAREFARRVSAGDTESVILNLCSMYGVVAAPNRLGYCATKSGVAMMTKSLAVEWAELNIRVNAIAPGYIRTALLEELIADGRVDAEALLGRTPQKRFGTVEEVADLAFFLASPETRFMTGQIVGLDGGWTANGYL